MTKRDLLVKEAMKANPITVKSDITVKDAAKIMKNKGIGNCIVVDNQPIGIVTESDIIKKVVAEGLDAGKILIKDIMTTPVIVIDPYVDIEEAMKTMSKCKIRRLPVVEKGKLVGIITQRDVIYLSPMLLELSREWSSIDGGDETHRKKQVFSGKCEDCGMLSTNLKIFDGRSLCEECSDGLKYE